MLRFSKSCKRSVSTGFRKNPRIRFGSWWRHYKLMYTPAVEHSACPLRWAANAATNARLRQVFLASTDVPCIRQQCRGDNYLGRSFERPGYIASRPWQDAITALFDLHLDHWTTTSSLRWQPALSAVSALRTQCNVFNASNATYTTSGQWHGWNLSRDMACVKLEAYFRFCVACVNLAYGTVRRHIMHARTWTSGDVPTCCNVSRRTSTQDTAYAKIICYLP